MLCGWSGGSRRKGVAYTLSHLSWEMATLNFVSTMPREMLSLKCQPNPVPTAGVERPSMKDLGG